MDRALASEHVAEAFGGVQLSELPNVTELTNLIAELEIELVRGLTETGFRTDLSPLRRSAWYLHGIASTAETAQYPYEQRRRAFAVSAHILDLLLEDSSETSPRVQLTNAFAAQVGYHRADESPNAAAIYRRMRGILSEPIAFIDGADVALHAGILFLGLDITMLNQHLKSWTNAADAQLDNLDGTMFGSTQRLLWGISDLAQYFREGSTAALESAQNHLLSVVRAEVGLCDVETRWVAGHLLTLSDGLSESSIWAVIPPSVPTAVKQAFTLSPQPVLTLWPPQRSLLTHQTISPLSQSTSRLLMSVPTSAGKTLLAQLIICTHISQDDRGVCYVTPLRSLAREMRQSLRFRLNYLGHRLGPDLPDGFDTYDFSDSDLGDKGDRSDQPPQVEVMTPERLMNALRQTPEEVLSRFSLFIIDEAHLIAEPGGRGLLLEGLLTFLDASGARLMLFSGVMGNAASLAAWTSTGQDDVLFTDDWRAPRRLHILTTTDKIKSSRTVISGRRGAADKIRYSLRARLAVRPTRATQKHLVTSNDAPIGQLVLDTNNKRLTGKDNTTQTYATTAKLASRLLRAGNLLMIVSQRNIARDAAKVLAAELDDNPRSQNLTDLIAARIGADHPLIGCLRKGIAYHHAGLPVEVQEAVEDALRDGNIKAVVATSTLTDGVNLPVRTVVIATTEYKGQDPSQRMSPAQLLNAVGRAGRAGKESEGWLVLALQKRLEDSDFDRLTPTSSDLEVNSSLTDATALTALAEAEEVLAQTQDAILRLPINRATGGFVSYVWFILHTLEQVPDLAQTGTWHDLVTRLFGFTQLPEDLKVRWLKIAEVVADHYAITPQASRRRWAQAGTSLESAAIIESIATGLADKVQHFGGLVELSFQETLDILAEQDVYNQLLQLPEVGNSWKFRVSARGAPIEVAIDTVLRDWIGGRDLTELANTHLTEVPDLAFRLEQMVDAITEGIQHYLSWTVGLVITQTNEILASRLNLIQLYQNAAAHLRYGVESPIAIDLLVRDVKSRRLAHDIGSIADKRGLDAEGVREYLSELHIHGWREDLDATPADVYDLLHYVQSRERNKLNELMATGASTAHIRHNSIAPILPPQDLSIPVRVVASTVYEEIEVLTEDGTLLGMIIASDHVDVATVLESGLLLDFKLMGTTLTMTRS